MCIYFTTLNNSTNSRRFSHNNRNNYVPRYLQEACKSIDWSICYPEGLPEVEVNGTTHYMNLLQIRFEFPQSVNIHAGV